MNYRHSQELIKVIEILDDWLDHGVDMKKVGDNLYRIFSPNHVADHELRTESDWQRLTTYISLAELCQNTQDSAELKKAFSAKKSSLQNESAPLKAAFFTQEFSLWPSFQTVWEACGSDVDKDLVFIYGKSISEALNCEESERYIEAYVEAGYPIKHSEEYDVELDDPDIVFYMKPYYGFRGCTTPFYINHVKKYTPYTAFISYCLDVQGGELLQYYFYGEPLFYHVWRIVGYSDYYRKKNDRARFSQRRKRSHFGTSQI